METSNEINELVSAMVKFQSEVESPKKSTANPAFKREGKPLKYADLDAIVKVVTPALSKHGLSQMQFTSTDIEQKSVTVTTMILHSSGQFIKSDPIVLPAENFGKFNAQTIGSSITYGRRYSLSAMLGIASEDDDDANTQSLPDNSAKKPEPKQQQNQQSQQQQPTKQQQEKELTDLIVNYVKELTSFGVDINQFYDYIANKEGVKSVSEVDKVQVLGYLKAQHLKIKSNQTKQQQQQQQQGSILQDRSTQPATTVSWGSK